MASATYISSSSFSIVGDVTSLLASGQRVKCLCGVDGVKYGTVLSSTYSDPNTTVTLTESSQDITENLSNVYPIGNYFVFYTEDRNYYFEAGAVK